MGGFILISLLAAGYVAAFAVLHPVVGDSVVALTVVPLVVGGWTYGLRIGTLVAVVLVSLNILLMQTIGGYNAIRATEIPRMLIGVGLGAVAGWVRDASRRLRDLIEENRRIEAALRAGTQDLERAVAQRTDELVRANQALEEEVIARGAAEANLRGMIEGSHDAIWVVRSGRIAFANRALAALRGEAAVTELVGRDPLALVQASDRKELEARMSDVLAGKEVSAPLELKVPCRDGTTRVVDASVFLVKLDGQPAAMTIGRDVTERKEFEARAAAADRMAVLGTLTAGIGHEINNPLAVISTNLDTLAKRASGGDPEEVEAINDALAAARTAGEIVKGMRIFTQASESAHAADVRRVVESTVRLVANEIRHRARLELDIASTPPVALAEAHLGQVLLNLLINASQSLPDGRAEQSRILVSVRPAPDGTRVRLEVSDTGGGIPADVRDHIFDPFFTTKPVAQGTGLGLWVCHQIVTASGGDIAVESAPGRGTTFRVDLPVATSLVTAPPVALGTPEVRRARVLVLDDDPMVCRAISRLLRGIHDLTIRNDAEVVLSEIAAGQRYDVILCDLMMPDMTGAEFFARLQARAPGQAERVIFMTGGAFTAETSAFLREPSHQPQLEKPFTPVALESAIQQVLHREVA